MDFSRVDRNVTLRKKFDEVPSQKTERMSREFTLFFALSLQFSPLSREGDGERENRVALVSEDADNRAQPSCLELAYLEWRSAKRIKQRNTNLAPVTLPQMIGSSYSLNAQLDEFQVHLLATRKFR